MGVIRTWMLGNKREKRRETIHMSNSNRLGIISMNSNKYPQICMHAPSAT